MCGGGKSDILTPVGRNSGMLNRNTLLFLATFAAVSARAVTFYSENALPDGAVLLTFPAGTAVDPAEFSISRAVGVDGAAKRIARLETKVNGDGTISLLKSSYGFIIRFN